MPPERLLDVLRRRHRLPAAALLRELGVSRATLMRTVRAAGAGVLAMGRTRRTAYAARRPLRGRLDALPVFRVDAAGQLLEAGRLHLAYPHGTWWEGDALAGWPLLDDMRDGWFEGLPYVLQDMRPEGWLGRAFARQHAALLQVPEDPRAWSDDDTLHALSLVGADTVGDFIVGDSAARLWLARRAASPEEVGDDELASAYPALADLSLRHGEPGSSAGGEFPKFTAVRRTGGRTAHVLVKFSGSDGSASARRWADLLVCEQLALHTVGEWLPVAAARSRIVQAGGRTFLEVERFDRQGAWGRSPLCSWAAVNHALFGLAGRPWADAAQRLAAAALIDAATKSSIEQLWHFGRLIANADMHDGNLSFVPSDGGLRLAPAYDMLPMAHAPQRGLEVRADASWAPPAPLPAERDAWLPAAQAALAFWQRAAGDERISRGFRTLCRRSAAAVEAALKAAATAA